MRTLRMAGGLGLLVGLCLAPGVGPSAAGLKDENLLVSMPPSFKVGDSAHQGNMDIQEWVPLGETVNNWTAMITVQIFHGQGGASPKAFVGRVASGWRSACRGGDATDIQEGAENGYGYSFWLFSCPLNPQTGKPENMSIKAVSGADALYSVQYATRRPLTKAFITAGAQYLRQVKVCDNRRPERTCPRGM